MFVCRIVKGMYYHPCTYVYVRVHFSQPSYGSVSLLMSSTVHQ